MAVLVGLCLLLLEIGLVSLMSKTKKVAGVDLSASSFAYVGDGSDTSTWKLPIHVPGDQTKTINLIRDALGRFQQTRGIADADIESVRCVLIGAAKAHGLKIDDRFRRIAPTVELSPAEQAMHRELKALKEDFAKSEAVADFKADSILRALGIE